MESQTTKSFNFYCQTKLILSWPPIPTIPECGFNFSYSETKKSISHDHKTETQSVEDLSSAASKVEKKPSDKEEISQR